MSPLRASIWRRDAALARARVPADPRNAVELLNRLLKRLAELVKQLLEIAQLPKNPLGFSKLDLERNEVVSCLSRFDRHRP